MREILKDLCDFSKTVEFLKFAYELRKADIDDQFSEQFLKDYVEIPVVFEIIMANSWKNDLMEFDTKKLKVKLMKNQNQVLFFNTKNQNQKDNSLGVKNIKYLKKHEQPYLNITLTRGSFIIRSFDGSRRLTADRPFFPKGASSVSTKIDVDIPFRVEFLEPMNLMCD